MNQSNVNKLPVMERFYSIQGEGANSGKAAYFLRLAGCNVGCFWCDVKESWDIADDQYLSHTEILNDILDCGAKNIVITGGEPTQHDLTEIVKLFHKNNLEVYIETAGTNPINPEINWICLSPKKFKQPLEESFKKAHELKVIAFNQNDFKWAKELANKVSSSCLLYIQPEWSKEEEMLPYIINFVKENPMWRISLQTHKYMKIP